MNHEKVADFNAFQKTIPYFKNKIKAKERNKLGQLDAYVNTVIEAFQAANAPFTAKTLIGKVPYSSYLGNYLPNEVESNFFPIDLKDVEPHVTEKEWAKHNAISREIELEDRELDEDWWDSISSNNFLANKQPVQIYIGVDGVLNVYILKGERCKKLPINNLNKNAKLELLRLLNGELIWESLFRYLDAVSDFFLE